MAALCGVPVDLVLDHGRRVCRLVISITELKTQKNDASIEEFLNSVEHSTRRDDSFKLWDKMKDLPIEQGSLWGESIIGFGD